MCIRDSLCGKRVRSGLLHRRLYRLRRDGDRTARDAHEAVFRRHRVQIRAEDVYKRQVMVMVSTGCWLSMYASS